jgi:Flp pilus assembly protein TadD
MTIDRSAPLAAARLIDAGRAADAVPMLHDFLASHPDDAPSLSLLSVALLRSGKPADALYAADRAVAQAPDDALSWQRRCLVLMELDRMSEAEVAARECLRLAPDDWHTHYTMARVLRPMRGKRQEAMRHAVRAVELAPDNADAHNLVGVIYRAMEDRVNAERAYRAALAIDPTHALARSNLALLGLGQGNPGQDIDTVMAGLREAAANDPQQAVIHRNMVLVAVLAMARRGAWLATIDLGAAWWVSAVTTGPHLVAGLLATAAMLVGWVVVTGLWLRGLRPYLRSLVPGMLARLLRMSDARWSLIGVVVGTACAVVGALLPHWGTAVVAAGYVALLGGALLGGALSARNRQRASADRP